jgi:soluble P-type ATPase
MIELNIAGYGNLQIEHLVSDVNGTLAIDGQLIAGLNKRIASLQDRLTIHLLTADTHGRQRLIDEQLNLKAVIIKGQDEAGQKAAFVRKLGAEKVVALGQGANDSGMLKEAALGICVLSQEGVATQTLAASDIVVPDIFAAFDLLDKPLRIVASLRR